MCIRDRIIPSEGADAPVLRREPDYSTLFTTALLSVAIAKGNRIKLAIHGDDGDAVAREIANQSITLIKNSNHLIPIDQRFSIPIIWPKEYEKSLQLLLKNCSNLKPFLLSIEPSDEERNALQEKIQDNDIKIIASYDLHRNAGWKELVNAISNQKTIIIALRSPYDFLKVTDYGAAVATYGDRPVSIEALGKILKGEIQPNGQLPVELPGRYQLGWGLKEF